MNCKELNLLLEDLLIGDREVLVGVIDNGFDYYHPDLKIISSACIHGGDMLGLFEWFPQALVGTVFIFIAVLKLYGLARGIEGGGGKPFVRRLCGT